MSRTDAPTIVAAGAVMRPGDADELLVLARELAADPEANPWLGTDVPTTMRWFTDPNVTALVVECDGRAAGVVTFEEEDDPDYDAASIDIGLLGWCVNRGVGTAVLKALVGWLVRERGHHRVTIDPNVANTRAIRVYEKVGFRPVGVMREYERGSDGTWHDSLLMDLLAREFEG